jgi:hypothetical protein
MPAAVAVRLVRGGGVPPRGRGVRGAPPRGDTAVQRLVMNDEPLEK